MAHQYTTMVLGWINVVNNVQPCRCSANGMRRRSDVVVLSGVVDATGAVVVDAIGAVVMDATGAVVVDVIGALVVDATGALVMDGLVVENDVEQLEAVGVEGMRIIEFDLLVVGEE